MSSDAVQQLDAALAKLAEMRQMLETYDTTRDLIRKMTQENEANLGKVARTLTSMVGDVKKIASTPGAKSAANAPKLKALSLGMREVLTKSKEYPTWKLAAQAEKGGRPRSKPLTGRSIGRPKSFVNPTAPKHSSSGQVKQKVTTTLGSSPWRKVSPSSSSSSSPGSSGSGSGDWKRRVDSPPAGKPVAGRKSPARVATPPPSASKEEDPYPEDDDSDDGKDWGELKAWLDKFGLAEHFPKLKEFGVDLPLLRLSGPSDLQELGLTPAQAQALADAACGKAAPPASIPETLEQLLEITELPHLASVFKEFDVDMRIIKMAGVPDLLELGLKEEEARAIANCLAGKPLEPKTVEEFLTRIGQTKYLTTFQEFDIEWRILKQAGRDDLKELGLNATGVDVIHKGLAAIEGTKAHEEAASAGRAAGRPKGEEWITRETQLAEPPDLGKFEIDYAELTIGQKIGEGGFATVHKGTWKGRTVAIKVMKFGMMDSKSVLDFQRELSVLSQLKHPNITDFCAATSKPPNLTVVMEYVEKGALSELLREKSVDIPWKYRLKMCKDVALGIHYLHSLTPKIIHRDIKAANVLVTEDWGAKVCDFGLSKMKTSAKMRRSVMIDPRKAMFRRSVVEPSQQAMGTPAWAAPELLDNQLYSESVDTYSYGVFLWEVATREKPHANKSDYSIVMDVNMMGIRPDVPGWVGASFKELIETCWDKDHTKRPTFAAIISSLTDIQREPAPDMPN